MNRQNERKDRETHVEYWKEKEVSLPITDVEHDEDQGFELCFQKCVYHYASGITETGYRFIRRKPDKTLQAARGQACIPTIEMACKLIQMAKDAGWGHDEPGEKRYGSE